MRPPSLTLSLAPAGLLASVASAFIGPVAHAQTTQGTLEPVEVRAARSTDAQAAETLEQARQDLARRAGATAVVDAASFTDRRAATAVDALSFAPGCWHKRGMGKTPGCPSAARAFSAAF